MNDDTEVTTTALDAATTEVLDTAPQAADKKKISFSSEQQTKLEQLIRAAKSEAAKELRREHAETLKENAALRASLNLPQQTQDELAAMNDKLAQATAELARVDGLSKKAAKSEALRSATTAANFFDPAVAATLISDQVEYQGEALVVVGKDGEPRLNSYGERMSLKELAAETADKYKYMVKCTMQFGAGSVQAGNRAPVEQYKLTDLFGPSSDGALANKVAMRDKALYNRLRTRARAEGLVN